MLLAGSMGCSQEWFQPEMVIGTAIVNSIDKVWMSFIMVWVMPTPGNGGQEFWSKVCEPVIVHERNLKWSAEFKIRIHLHLLFIFFAIYIFMKYARNMSHYSTKHEGVDKKMGTWPSRRGGIAAKLGSKGAGAGWWEQGRCHQWAPPMLKSGYFALVAMHHHVIWREREGLNKKQNEGSWS